jgi:hypothetical protein
MARVTTLLRLFAGLLIWAIAFAVVYGLQGLGCAQGWHRFSLGPYQALRAILVAAWLAFLVAAALWARYGVARQGPGDGVLPRLERGVAVTGAVAIAYTLFPVAWTSACAA